MTTPGKSSNRRRVLFMVMGTSPAILTETCWTLDEQGQKPDEVCIVTTSMGRDILENALFDKGTRVWERMWKQRGTPPPEFAPLPRFINVLTRAGGQAELSDILTSEDHEAAADQIMRTLRSFVSDPSVQVIASLAGGRKTMGAILTSCMVLLGRPGDRLCHVLVNPPFDGFLKPPFFYPEDPPILHLDRGQEEHSSNKARIYLLDLPVVQMLPWYQDRFQDPPGSYMDLVKMAQGNLTAGPTSFPRVEMRARELTVRVGEQAPVAITWRQWVLLYHVYAMAKQGHFPYSWIEAGDMLEELQGLAGTEVKDIPWLWEWHQGDCAFPNQEGARNVASQLRKRLKSYGVPTYVRERLVPDLKHPPSQVYPISAWSVILTSVQESVP